MRRDESIVDSIVVSQVMGASGNGVQDFLQSVNRLVFRRIGNKASACVLLPSSFEG
jgi:hypothetical protein